MNVHGPFSEQWRSVQREYAREAPGYDTRWRRYTEASLAPTLALLPVRAGERLLDVGCGTGVLLERVLQRAPGVRGVGVDVSAEMLAAAERRLRGRAALVLAAAERLPFAAGAFDAVASSSSLHYWRDPAAGLAELARVTRAGGRLALTDWDPAHLPTRVRDLWLRVTDPAHRRVRSGDELRRLLTEAGFAVTATRSTRGGGGWGFVTLAARR